MERVSTGPPSARRFVDPPILEGHPADSSSFPNRVSVILGQICSKNRYIAAREGWERRSGTTIISLRQLSSSVRDSPGELVFCINTVKNGHLDDPF
jgi:hypothetical protein